MSSSAWAMWARSWSGSGLIVSTSRSRRPSRSYESSPAWSLTRLTRSRSARSREASSTSVDALGLDHRHAVGVEHQDVALADRGAADATGCADRARGVLDRRPSPGPSAPRSGGRARPAPRRRGPRRRPGSRRRRGPWPGWPAGRRPAPPAAARACVRTSTSPGWTAAIAAWTIRLSSWPQTHGSRRAGDARARDDLDQVGVDVAPTPAGLVHGGRPESGELLVHLSLTARSPRWG